MSRGDRARMREQDCKEYAVPALSVTWWGTSGLVSSIGPMRESDQLWLEEAVRRRMPESPSQDSDTQ